MAQQVKNPPAMQETQEIRVSSLGREDPSEEEMATCSSLLPGESHGQRNLMGYSSKGCKKLDVTEHRSIKAKIMKLPEESMKKCL